MTKWTEVELAYRRLKRGEWIGFECPNCGQCTSSQVEEALARSTGHSLSACIPPILHFACFDCGESLELSVKAVVIPTGDVKRRET